MAFDSQTRNRLARFVADARTLITDEFTEKFQSLYGLSPSGEITPLADLRHLDEEEKATAERLRARLHHLEADAKDTDRVKSETIEHLTREQAFTVLNRLAAIRMAEKRGIIIESVGRGYESKGFKVYLQVAGNALGDTYHKYRRYLFCLFDELAVDLGSLFDRRSSAGLLFLREPALVQLLQLLNAPDLEPLWAEDETIGWIYQYYNDPTERKKMREQSSAPRNSRELAVRNQFFTPRYVVEFLTDNTLGRVWHEMTKGQSRLKEECRYLVRQPDEVFLDPFGDDAEKACGWLQGNKGSMPEFWALALTVNAYFRAGDAGEASNAWVEMRLPRVTEGQVNDFSTQELLDLLFLFCRKDRFCEGTLDALHKEVQLILRTIQKRVESPQSTDLSQEALLRQPVFIQPRALKDPREIRMLDPACGSMHFGLYSFDLFEVIYDEAWDIAHAQDKTWKSSEGFAPFVDFVAQYPDKASFLREVPRFIIEHNIHGIDIDPRCTQIAGLSLWLRAQRTWQQQHLQLVKRPRIRRSNIVCAEPMPGEEAFLDEFIEGQLSGTAEKNLLGQLVHRVFNAMKLAGEAGSLLKIEEEIASAVADAKQKWLAGPKFQQGRLFADDTGALTQKELRLDVTAITDETFWERAEEQIYAALQAYAERVDDGGGYQRRLFADDAARGFAFIELSRKHYDVVLMNPPFGAGTYALQEYLQKVDPITWTELFTAMVKRSLSFAPEGLIGSITSRSSLTLTRLTAWRSRDLVPFCELIADLGIGVMDNALVEACVYVCRLKSPHRNFLVRNLHTCVSPGEQLLAHTWTDPVETHVVERTTVQRLPEQRILVALPAPILKLLQTGPYFEPAIGTVRRGFVLFDGFRFVRLFWEVEPSDIGRERSWVWYSKGGDYQRHYGSIHLVALRANDGAEMCAVNQSKNGQTAQAMQGSTYYFRPGATYTSRSQRGFAPRCLPAGCITSDSPAVLSESATSNQLILGWLNSRMIRLLIELQASFHKYEPGLIKNLPWPPSIDYGLACEVERRTKENVLLSRELSSWDETDATFAPDFGRGSIREMCHEWTKSFDRKLKTVSQNQNRVTEIFDSIYGCSSKEVFESLGEFEDDDVVAVSTRESRDFASGLISWLVGVAFGRWDIRCVTGEKLAPVSLDPFAPLPTCSPGMLRNTDGLPLTKNDVSWQQTTGAWYYPLDFPWDGVLVDDPGHASDLEVRVHQVLQIDRKERWEDVEQEACEILGVKTLREYFRKAAGFFADHLKRYSKSRRQAPIYWPLSTASGSYTLWLYYPRITDQTLHTVLADFLEPKIRTVDQEAQWQKDEGRTQKYGEYVEFLDELKALRAEIERIINLPWKPNLNDGVLITASALWKLFRLGKWQKDLKACWEELEGGEYDWAHLALSIWPDRVKQKCETDRSLAIAHGLEELCTVEGPKPKKRKTSKKKAGEEEAEKLLET
jgi:hypothetical protein